MMFRIVNYDIRAQAEESSSMSFTSKLTALSAGFHARLSETSGTTFADSINSNNGNIGFTPTLGQTGGGIDGNLAVEFDGTTRRYGSWTGGNITDGENWNTKTRSDRTWGIAFRTDSNSLAQTLLQLGGRDAGIHTYIASSGNVYINATNGDALNYFNSHAVISASTWYFIVNVQDDSEDTITSYLFGADGHVGTMVVDISSFTDEDMYELIAIGTATGSLATNLANIRNHANFDSWDEGEKFFDGRKNDLFYIPGTAISEADAFELAKRYFLNLNTDAPAIADSITVTQDSNTDNVSADISGWTLAEGDLIIVAATIDGAEAGNTAITQTGFTEHYSTQTSNSFITGCLYSRELALGDTSWTSIELTWSGNEKAVMRVFRIVAAEHNGIDTVATPSINDGSTTPSLPAVTLATNSKALAIAHLNGSATVDINPRWYISDDQTTASGGGPSTQWVGLDELSGSQSADTLTISSAQASVVSVASVSDAAASGITGTGAYTIPGFTFSGAGTVIVEGTGSYTIPSFTYSGAGSVGSAVAGSGSYTLPSFAYSGAGTVIIEGTGSYELPSLTYSGAGAVGAEVFGTGTYQLPMFTFSAAGTVIIEGTGTYTLPAFTYEGTNILAGAVRDIELTVQPLMNITLTAEPYVQ